MALHWQYIKGFYQSNSTSANMRYTFIHFKDGTQTEEERLPDIYISEQNSLPDASFSLGHIVTNKVANTFYNTITLNGSNKIYFNGLNNYIGENSNIFTIYSTRVIQLNGSTQLAGRTTFTYTNGTGTNKQNSDLAIEGFSWFDKAVKINSACNATYFNATSDARAKENINPVTTSMLDIANSIQLYTFNYKNNSERLIGVIAQELKDINIDGFELIDNKNATGEDNDFMSVRESKLIYILLGAVQELSKEIKELKKKIGE